MRNMWKRNRMTASLSVACSFTGSSLYFERMFSSILKDMEYCWLGGSIFG